MKPPKVKAEFSFRSTVSNYVVPPKIARLVGKREHPHHAPVYILPADAESYERMVAQVAQSLCRSDNFRPNWATSYSNAARAALRAIGIVSPKRGKKGRQ